MKPGIFRSSLFGLAGSIVLASSLLAQADATFSKANQEYAEGKFKEAIADYESIVHDGKWSATVFYNLGNAFFRTNDLGQAILSYERALALQPNHPEARANLKVARDEARALPLAPNWADRFGPFLSSNQSAIAAAVLFWIFVFLGVASLFAPRRKSLLGLALCALILAGGLIFFMMTLERGARGASLAIVTGTDVRARLATADSAATVMILPAGSQVRVDQARGDWAYVDLPNNQRGWIPTNSIELVRL